MKVTFVFLIIACVATCNAQERKEVTADAYDVYSAVLTQQYGSWFKQPRSVLVLSRTVLEPQGHSGGDCRAQAEKDPIARKLFDKLLSENQQLRIEPRFRLPGPYKISGKMQAR